jgi:hypothetical protein
MALIDLTVVLQGKASAEVAAGIRMNVVAALHGGSVNGVGQRPAPKPEPEKKTGA